MKGDGEGESEGARENGYGKPNNDIKVTRRAFVKTTAAFGAAVAGIPYNLTDITDVFLKEDGELIIYPVIYQYEHEFVSKYNLPPFKRNIYVATWGCNWDCRWCSTKFSIFKDMIPIRISIDRITDLLLNLGGNKETTLQISGGEPLIQKEGVLKLIESLKTKTNYTVILLTNGSLIEEDFIDEVNNLGQDGIVITFYSLDDEWHRWYTGYSNKDTINALELVTKKFKGLTVVSMIPFPHIDTIAYENMCMFLQEINPNFVIKIQCPHTPYYPHHGKENCQKCIRREAEGIASHYFRLIDRTLSFSKRFKMRRYLIEEDESGHVDLVKSQKWIRIKKGGEFIKVG